MIRIPISALLWTIAAFFQSIVIPSQTVPLPAATLPAGMTYTSANGGLLTVTGAITATLGITPGGAALPTCPGNIYVYQLTPATNTVSVTCQGGRPLATPSPIAA